MRPIAIYVALGGLLLACQGWLTSCIGIGPCMSSLPGALNPLWLMIAAVALLAVVTSAAWLARVGWLIASSAIELGRLRPKPAPYRLRTMAARVGVGRLRFLASPGRLAFSAGVFRPTVYMSLGAYRKLDDRELTAVLLHELEHVSALDPLRRVAWRAATDVFFFLPLLSWLRSKGTETSELRADRRAMASTGAKPVASALWSLVSDTAVAGSAAFTGSVDARIAQLLGDPLPPCRPSATLYALSIAGLGSALALVACAAQIAVGLS